MLRLRLGLAVEQPIKNCMNDEQQALQQLGSQWSKIHRFKQSKLQVANEKRWWYAELCQFIDMPPDGPIVLR